MDQQIAEIEQSIINGQKKQAVQLMVEYGIDPAAFFKMSEDQNYSTSLIVGVCQLYYTSIYFNFY